MRATMSEENHEEYVRKLLERDDAAGRNGARRATGPSGLLILTFALVV